MGKVKAFHLRPVWNRSGGAFLPDHHLIIRSRIKEKTAAQGPDRCKTGLKTGGFPGTDSFPVRSGDSNNTSAPAVHRQGPAWPSAGIKACGLFCCSTDGLPELVRIHRWC